MTPFPPDQGTGKTPAPATSPQPLNGARQPLEQIADWNATQFARLAASGLIWIRASDLPRDLVADHAQLAASHLARRLVPVPP